MAARPKIDQGNFIFDDSRISWGPFPYVENAEFALSDFDEERRVIDVLFKFAANKKITVHTHIQQTNMLVVQGELRIYETDGSIKEIRHAGQYFRGKKDDTAHLLFTVAGRVQGIFFRKHTKRAAVPLPTP